MTSIKERNKEILKQMRKHGEKMGWLKPKPIKENKKQLIKKGL